VRAWLPTAWPSDNVVYPGRDLPWEAWDALPDKE
jgi:hypothetical protein